MDDNIKGVEHKIEDDLDERNFDFYIYDGLIKLECYLASVAEFERIYGE